MAILSVKEDYMTQNITSYYVPQNLHIKKGKIYTLYLNTVSNLDLTSIISKDNKNENSIEISNDDYNQLMILLDTSTKLYKQSQELATKIGKGRGK